MIPVKPVDGDETVAALHELIAWAHARGGPGLSAVVLLGMAAERAGRMSATKPEVIDFFLAKLAPLFHAPGEGSS